MGVCAKVMVVRGADQGGGGGESDPGASSGSVEMNCEPSSLWMLVCDAMLSSDASCAIRGAGMLSRGVEGDTPAIPAPGLRIDEEDANKAHDSNGSGWTLASLRDDER